MVFGEQRADWIALVVWTIAVFYQLPSAVSSSRNGRQQTRRAMYERREAMRSAGENACWSCFVSPPGWLFGVVWTLLYALMSATILIYWRCPTQLPRASTMVAILINLVLNKAWTPLYFGAQQRVAALFVAVGILATNIWIEVEFFEQVASGPSQQARDTNLLCALLWLPYTLWSAYAVFLNSMRISNGRKKRREQIALMVHLPMKVHGDERMCS